MNAPQPVIKQGRKWSQVLDGARTVFMRDGFEGASVDDIVREAGVSKATLYSYFPDKRHLFTEVARIECERMADETLACLLANDLPTTYILGNGDRETLAFAREKDRRAGRGG